MFLKAVGDHPWARADLISACSGLTDWEIEKVYRPLAQRRGLVERGDIPDRRRAPRRFGLTPAGAAVLGQTWSRSRMQEALMRALNLDTARALLAEWAGEAHCVVWSVSPFNVSARDLRPSKSHNSTRHKSGPLDRAYRSLRLDALACLRLDPQRYVSIALVVDPGGIRLDWYFHQFRAWYAWRQRGEFKETVGVFPALIMVAANEHRRVQLTQLWRAVTPAGLAPLRLRITTYVGAIGNGRNRPWWNERGERTSLWGGLFVSKLPGPQPAVLGGLKTLVKVLPHDGHPGQKAGLVGWVCRPRRRESLPARLVRLQLKGSAQGRELLERIGEYPLITCAQLAVVMARTPDALRAGLKELLAQGQIQQPPGESGYVLTQSGLALLAARAGHSAARYAGLMRWPLRRDAAGKPCYSIDAMRINLEHTRCVLDFLVGLRRYGPERRLALTIWDHVQCGHQFPEASSSVHLSDPKLLRMARVVPDAVGVVRAFGETAAQYVDTPFWLEIDRGTKRGRALTQQLEHSYPAGGAHTGLPGQRARILIVVARGGEARLQAIRRRILALNARRRVRLDARLATLGLLTNRQGKLDPTLKAWRAPASSNLVSAFNTWQLEPA